VQKSGLIVVILALLIITGLLVSIVGNQTTLEGIMQGNGEVSSTQTVTISADLDMNETPIGVFAVQVMEFKENTIRMKVLDPSDVEIISQEVNEDTLEEKFDVLETGTYELIIHSSDDEGIYVTGAIGPLPDESKKFIISIVSTLTLIIGMVGLIVIGIVEIKNRKRSV
jgi:hypothetical protein